MGKKARAVLLLAGLIGGCQAGRHPRIGGSPSTALTERECVERLSGESDVEALERAAERNLAGIDRRRDAARAAAAVGSPRAISAALLRALAAGERWREELCRRLTLRRVETASPVLLTGYYQPVLAARRARDERFRYPLYGPPAKGGAATASRGEIEAGALVGKAPAVAWLDDPVDAFFLHVQGSGQLEFTDGTSSFVHFAGSNGRPYTSIGRAVAEETGTAPAAMNLERLKQWLREHPKDRQRIMNRNERYIFFALSPTGAVGGLSVPLTDGHSLAADPSVYPRGALALIRGPRSDGSIARGLGVRLAFIQDEGAAIRGPSRLDLYAGTGDEAGRIAGALHAPVELYLFVTRSSAD